jgi:hypothetical protein
MMNSQALEPGPAPHASSSFETRQIPGLTQAISVGWISSSSKPESPWLLQELRPNVSSRYSILSVVTPSIPSLAAYFRRLEGWSPRYTRYWHVHIIMDSGSWRLEGPSA